jgi:hypothetical protein
VVVGMCLLQVHVDRAAVQLSHWFGHAGVALLSVTLAASRIAQAYAADQQRFLRDFVMQIWVASWPLVLVMVGTVLSRDALTDGGNTDARKDCGLVDLTDGRSTLK